MNKVIKVIYCGCFLAVCFAPLIAFPFVKKNAMLEKKALSDMPKYVTYGKINTDFADEFNTYLNDNFPFRSELLTAGNVINSAVLKTPSSNVVTGSDGFLFFASTVPDYLNTNAMSYEKIKSIVVTMSLIQERVEENGGTFVFVPVPNKNSIYSEMMPLFYKKSETNNLTRLYDELETSDVNYVDIKQDLLTEKDNLANASDDTVLYQKKDTHWNYIGANIGYKSIMQGLGRTDYAYEDVTYEAKTDWEGDLVKLLYPSGGPKDVQYYYQINTDDFRFENVHGAAGSSTADILADFMSDKEDNDKNITAVKNEQTDNSKLYMVRDSFGRALLPYMIESYDYSNFVRTNCPDINSLEEGTDMVYEIAERNLSDLVETAPFMYAPQRDVSYDSELSSDSNFAVAKDEGYAIRVYGTIDSDIYGDDGRIYVKLENGDESYTYEAFPIYESELLKDEKDSDESETGFSIMINSDEIAAGDYSISVISGGVSTGKISDIVIK